MIFCLALAGFATLAAGTWRQSAIIFGHVPRLRTRRALLFGGYGLLALSLAPVLTGRDAAPMLVEWFGLLTLAAIAVLVACWIRQRG